MDSFHFPQGPVEDWHGFRKHLFHVDGCDAWIVEPNRPADDGRWVWSMEFPDAFVDRCCLPQLADMGFFVAHIIVGNTFGCPSALKHMHAFYKFARQCGLAEKAVLQGISRGGLYAARFASEFPEAVSLIYGDAPVCDFKSWPGGKGTGEGYPEDWCKLIVDYGFRDEAEALAWKGNPVDKAEMLAKAGIPVLHVVGDADTVVPVSENSAVFAERFQNAGGDFKVIHKPGVGHHPHGLEDPSEALDFILTHRK